MMRSLPSGLIGLTEMPEVGAICFACMPFSERDHLRRVGGAGLVLDAGIQILGVLADDDEVDALVARAHPGVALARPHAGVEPELVAQGDVDGAKARCRSAS